MTHFTDLNLGMTPGLPDTAARVLTLVAGHFVDVRPTDDLEPEDLAVAVGAMAYDVCGRSISGRSADLAAVALSATPEPYVGITRGEYALWLILVLPRPSRAWEDDARDRAIPTVPRPRVPAKAPQPRVPDDPRTPIKRGLRMQLCCGSQMQPSGRQLVCGVCGSWIDPGVAAPAAALSVVGVR